MTKFFVFSVAVAMLFSSPPFSSLVFGQTTRTTNDPQYVASIATKQTSTPNQAVLGVMLNNGAECVSVTSVVPNSAAARAGLLVGDEIYSLADRRIQTTQELTEMIRNSKPGTQITIHIGRNGQYYLVTAKLGTHDSTFGPANQNATRVSYSQEPGSETTPAPQQSQASREGINALNQQMSLLNQQIDQLKQQLRQQPAAPRAGYDTERMDDWWNRNQRGQTRGDPALFQ